MNLFEKLPAILLSLLAPGVSCAQGYFLFKNTDIGPPRFDAPVFDSDGNPLEGSSYLAMLYVGAEQDSLEPVLWFDGGSIAVAPFAVSGYVLGGIVEARNVGGGADVFS